MPLLSSNKDIVQAIQVASLKLTNDLGVLYQGQFKYCFKPILDELKEHTRLLKKISFQLLKPKLPFIKIVGEIKNMLQFNVNLQPPKSFDVVKRELIVTVGEATPIVKEVSVSTVTVEDDAFAGKDNINVKIELVDIDDAGNRSEPAVVETVLIDKIPPEAPTGPTLMVIAEFPDPVVPEKTIPVEESIVVEIPTEANN